MSRRGGFGGAAALMGVEDPAEAERLARRVEGITRAFPAHARLGLQIGSGVLDVAARLRTGRALRDLDPARRDAVCSALASRRAGAALIDVLKFPVLLAAGTERLPGPEPAAYDGRPDPELDCVSAAGWPACSTADAVVIGSGAGGAMAARTLARAGMSVVVLEEGRRFRASDFRGRPPLDRFLDLYRDGGATIALGRVPVLLPSGRGVGGTTLINCGTSYRTPDRVLRRWADLGVDLDPAYLREVERILAVAEQPIDVLGRNGLIVLDGARRLGWRAAPLRRNAPGCDGCCQCIVGCPHNAKNGVHLNALPQACDAGARVVMQAQVLRVLTERGRAAGVRAVRPDGSSFEILSPVVVIAAGASQTPPLLRRSGLGGHPGIGRGMAVHPAASLAGRFEEPVVSWKGVLQSVGVEELHDQGILIEATASPPGMSSFVLPGVGRALRAELDGADRLAIVGAMIADAPSGRVYGRRRPIVRYDLARDDEAKLRRAIVAMGRILFAAGAREVLTGIARHPVGRSGSPVTEQGRLRGTRGVYIADASILPTCPEVNPQLTIMAMALSVAGHIVRAA